MSGLFDAPLQVFGGRFPEAPQVSQPMIIDGALSVIFLSLVELPLSFLQVFLCHVND